jgi:spermidine/putrescine transport system ATP-binding protein
MIIDKGDLSEGDEVFISIRPENMKYSIEKPLTFFVKASIKEHTYVGSSIRTIAVISNGQEIIMHDYDKKTSLPKEGTEVFILWKAEDMAVVKSKGGF